MCKVRRDFQVVPSRYFITLTPNSLHKTTFALKVRSLVFDNLQNLSIRFHVLSVIFSGFHFSLAKMSVELKNAKQYLIQ